jgi:hypothetical protein
VQQLLQYRSSEDVREVRPPGEAWSLIAVALIGFLWFFFLLLFALINLATPDLLDPHPIGRGYAQKRGHLDLSPF